MTARSQGRQQPSALRGPLLERLVGGDDEGAALVALAVPYQFEFE